MAESFGTDAERYHRSRPRYPAAMVDRILGSMAGRDVLDVGMGTGVAARPFAEAGCRVLGVDVDARMADFARRRGFDVEVASFEEWDPAGRTFDAVISGQAWHWVDPEAGAAKAAAVLRPAGRLAVFWNAFQFPTDLHEAIAGVYGRVLPDAPLFRGSSGGPAAYSGLSSTAADGIRHVGARFDQPEQWQFDWERRYTTAEWLDFVPTAGGQSQFPPATLAELLAGIGEAIDAVGGNFLMTYAAVVVTALRTSAPGT